MKASLSTWFLLGAAGLTVTALALVALLGPSPAPAGDEVVIDLTTRRYALTPGTDEPIRVPLGARVVLRVTSEDVTHGFAIDAFGVHAEIPAGQTVTIRFTASEAGDHVIYCTVFCGAEHPSHKGTLHVA